MGSVSQTFDLEPHSQACWPVCEHEPENTLLIDLKAWGLCANFGSVTVSLLWSRVGPDLPIPDVL